MPYLPRLREMTTKGLSDPLKDMTAHLTRRAEILGASSTSASASYVRRHSMPSRPSLSSSNPSLSERLTRESKERVRALELIARRKRETEGEMSVAETPREYADVYNVKEVHEARERRRGGTLRGREWNEDEDDGRRKDKINDRYSDTNRRRHW